MNPGYFATKKELKTMISDELKGAGIPKGWKMSLSVRDERRVNLTIQAAPFDLLKKINEKNLRRFQLTGRGEPNPVSYATISHVAPDDFEGEALDVMKKISAALNKYNYDHPDYHDYKSSFNYLTEINLGTNLVPFKVTAANVTA